MLNDSACSARGDARNAARTAQPDHPLLVRDPERAPVADEEAAERAGRSRRGRARPRPTGSAEAPSASPSRSESTAVPTTAIARSMTNRRAAASSTVASPASSTVVDGPVADAHLVRLSSASARAGSGRRRWWPGAERRRAAARSTSQCPSWKRGQRGWKRQALGGLIGFGTSPSSTIGCALRGRAPGSGSARPRAARPCTDASASRRAGCGRRSRRPCRGTSPARGRRCGGRR